MLMESRTTSRCGSSRWNGGDRAGRAEKVGWYDAPSGAIRGVRGDQTVGNDEEEG